MEIVPNVVRQNTTVDYVLSLKNTNYIKFIEIYSIVDYFHKDIVSYKIEKNNIFLTYEMPYVGEFIVRVHFKYKESKTVCLYCLDENMSNLKPLKGDLHMHSVYSDGKATPFAMSLASLEAGMDFISITDHDNYEGSQKAIKRVEKCNIDLLVLAGEEVSVGKKDMVVSAGNGHILSINANKSIENQRKNSKKYEIELQKIAKELEKENIDKSINPLHYARNIWVLNKIKEANGISILSHPNWMYHEEKYHLHQAIYKEMLKNSQLDGVEIMGEVKIEERNNMAYLTTLQTKNRHKYLAPTSNTDAHDIDHDIGKRFTILFAKEKTTSSIVDAIKDGFTCAVLKRDNGEHQFIAKDELAQYAYFLIREYYPIHNKLKNRLAKLYIDEFINDECFESKINTTKNRLENYTKSFFKS
jgi:hypothetical protein